MKIQLVFIAGIAIGSLATIGVQSDLEHKRAVLRAKSAPEPEGTSVCDNSFYLTPGTTIYGLRVDANQKVATVPLPKKLELAPGDTVIGHPGFIEVRHGGVQQHSSAPNSPNIMLGDGSSVEINGEHGK